MLWNKWTKWLVSLLLVGGLLTACGTNEEPEDATNNQTQTSETEDSNEAEEETEEITITISKNEGEETIDEKTVSIEEDAILMDVMEENFDVETEFEGAFVASIDGVGPEEDEDIAWMYSVNGTPPNVGADEYELEPGDEVVFDLQPF